MPARRRYGRLNYVCHIIHTVIVQRDGKVWTATACTRVKAKPNKETAKMENLLNWIILDGCSSWSLQLVYAAEWKAATAKPIVLLTSGCKHLWTFDGTSCKINEFVRKSFFDSIIIEWNQHRHMLLYSKYSRQICLKLKSIQLLSFSVPVSPLISWRIIKHR